MQELLKEEYYKFEVDSIAKGLETLSIEASNLEEETTKAEQEEPAAEISLIKQLTDNKKLMIDKTGQYVVKRPPPNQRCPCGSNKAYKKCSCQSTDKKRTDQFIADAGKQHSDADKSPSKCKTNDIIMV